MGSYADGSAISTSDIDGYILFRDGFTNSNEEQKAWQLFEHCKQMMFPEFNVVPQSEQTAVQLGNVGLKLNSLLLYGEDIRDRLQLLPLSTYTPMLVHDVCRFLSHLRHDPPSLTYPLDFPDSQNEFYGYDGRPLYELDGTRRPGTKALINCVGKIALAIVTLKAGVYVKNKSDCLRQYRIGVNDKWSGLIEEVYATVRQAWEYRLPESRRERRHLQKLCRRALAFENHFLTIYRDFLLEQIHSEAIPGLWMDIPGAEQLFGFTADSLRQHILAGSLRSQNSGERWRIYVEHPFRVMAVRMLGKVVYPGDTAVVDALESAVKAKNVLLREAAVEALRMVRKGEAASVSWEKQSW